MYIPLGPRGQTTGSSFFYLLIGAGQTAGVYMYYVPLWPGQTVGVYLYFVPLDRGRVDNRGPYVVKYLLLGPVSTVYPLGPGWTRGDAHLSGSWTVPWPLVWDSWPPLSFALLDQPPLPDHLENDLIWVDSIKMITFACCMMFLERLVETRKIPTTLMTLSLQLWNWTGFALVY